jgi:SAM-dependent methyltransferase
MAQTTGGLYAILSRPTVYSLFEAFIGALTARERVIREYVRPKAGDHILDIGCGPGDVVGFLPEGVRYVGFDENSAYIRTAQRRFGGRAVFRCERLGEKTLAGAERGAFDIALALGVVHHLDDPEALELFRLAALALKPGGQLFALDGCYVAGQSRWARWMLSKDRGRNIRTPEQYLRLAAEVFHETSTVIRHDLMRVPYTLLVLQCRRSEAGEERLAASGRQAA